MTTGQEWRRLALCLGKDPALWGAGAHVEYARDNQVAKQLEEGKAICNTPCPAREACLAEAMSTEPVDDKHRSTIRGGLTAVERQALALRIKRNKSKAGAA